MKAYKLKVLAGCIAFAVSGTSWAAQNDTHAHHDSKLDNVSNSHKSGSSAYRNQLFGDDNGSSSGLNQLFDEAKGTITLRTAYFNRNFPKSGYAGYVGKEADAAKNADSSQGWTGSAIGAQFGFESGYAWNHIGFDWTVLSALSLSTGGNKEQAAGELISARDNGDLRSSLLTPDGFANIKFKAGGKDANFHGRVGYLDMESEFLGISNNRVVPSSYRGIHLESFTYGLNLYANVANAMRERTATGMENFKSAAGDRISYIGEVGGSYQLDNGLGLSAAYGEGHNYVREYTAAATYKVDVPYGNTLELKGQTWHAKKAGSLWNGEAGTKFDDLDGFKNSADANTLSVATHLLEKQLKLQLSYTKTQAKGGKGFYQYTLAHNDTAGWKAPNSVDSDFNHDGESAYQALVDYKFDKAGIPGLETSVIYTEGNGINYHNNSNIAVSSEHEVDYNVSYAFQQPALKNLKLHATLYDLYQEGANGNKNSHSPDLRVYADYTVSVF